MLIKNTDYKVGKSLFKLPTENDTVTTSKSSGESEKVLTTKAPETETVSEVCICSFFFNERHCS